MQPSVQPDRRAAKREVAQGVTGAILTLFLLLHLHLEASILFGKEAFDAMASFLHAGWADPTGHGYSFLVVIAAAILMFIVLLHVYAVSRKIPVKLAQYRKLREHGLVVNHGGTRLWRWQLYSGLAMLLLIPIHLITMMVIPEQIGSEQSAARIVYDGGWLLYGLLMPLSIIHATAGITRLWLKWCPISEPRFFGRSITRGVTVYLIVLGTASLLMHIYNGLQA
ncbi:succinate dehydrogenase/fumarate reductase cytochrome b subunit [Ferrimonas lipolytica]|uniref:Succinate dehydrogenase/fumarate reductase cytochrome b subunit n=1 Tax=Ferrimonas lipolytica TaxID=2724191 RepID=A0A6H1UK59_9GAMM|nr:succinate dehydrogenase/fumarate reductase cytochrome b subunit [Ferrimonas lipolytica]QIZ78606.1 succinate dehydrogenase/fumarate reductase cytochrome b subunit [Ferrimonas lipolytica]